MKVILSPSPGFGSFKWPWLRKEDVEKGRSLVVVVRASRDGDVRRSEGAMFHILAVRPAKAVSFSIEGGWPYKVVIRERSECLLVPF